MRKSRERIEEDKVLKENLKRERCRGMVEEETWKRSLSKDRKEKIYKYKTIKKENRRKG